MPLSNTCQLWQRNIYQRLISSCTFYSLLVFTMHGMRELNSFTRCLKQCSFFSASSCTLTNDYPVKAVMGNMLMYSKNWALLVKKFIRCIIRVLKVFFLKKPDASPESDKQERDTFPCLFSHLHTPGHTCVQSSSSVCECGIVGLSYRGLQKYSDSSDWKVWGRGFMDDMDDSSRVKLRHLDHPLVACCSIGHKQSCPQADGILAN